MGGKGLRLATEGKQCGTDTGGKTVVVMGNQCSTGRGGWDCSSSSRKAMCGRVRRSETVAAAGKQCSVGRWQVRLWQQQQLGKHQAVRRGATLRQQLQQWRQESNVAQGVEE